MSVIMKTTVRGPLFDGRAAEAVADYVDEAGRDIAELGQREVQNRLGHVLQHPTGFYRSHVTVDRSRDDHTVTDGGVIYGPWLEGVSSRNQTTRFKGYATFRRVGQWVNSRARDVAEDKLSRYLPRMGGHG